MIKMVVLLLLRVFSSVQLGRLTPRDSFLRLLVTMEATSERWSHGRGSYLTRIGFSPRKQEGNEYEEEYYCGTKFQSREVSL
jgi:hypothetical protein